MQNLSPTEGRYSIQCDELRDILSEEAHIRQCLDIELQYWRFITRTLLPLPINIADPTDDDWEVMIAMTREYDIKYKHDIKAVEYAVRGYISSQLGPNAKVEYVHYGLTSQDIVSCSYTLRIRQSYTYCLLPAIQDIVHEIHKLNAKGEKEIYCITHGQKGNLTTTEKEFTKLLHRLDECQSRINMIRWKCKFSGSTGDLTTMYILHSEIDWHRAMNNFLSSTYAVDLSVYTTQTDYWDSVCQLFLVLRDVCNILTDFCRDLWLMYMNGDITLFKENADQVGSSVMPQKINPIDFENAEGNFEMCDMWFSFLTSKLAKSRLQRDLSDSVVMRHVPLPISNMLIGMKSLTKGIRKINTVGIAEVDCRVFGELIQTSLRGKGDANAYEKIKTEFQRNEHMSSSELFDVILPKLNIKLDKNVEDYIKGKR